VTLVEVWILLSLIVLIAWGLWGFMLKYAELQTSWFHVYVASVAGLLTMHFIAITILALNGKMQGLELNRYTLIAYIGGLFGALGGLLFILALRFGEASLIIPLTSLYPIIAVILSILILGESITAKKIAGIIFVVVAIILISTPE